MIVSVWVSFSSWVLSVFTVALVATGMKAGVVMVPCAVLSSPVRAPFSSAISLNILLLSCY